MTDPVPSTNLYGALGAPRRSVVVDGSRTWFAVVPPLAILLLLLVLFRTGNRGNDDLGYAQLALSILDAAQTPIQSGPHHAARVGLTLPLAGVFWVLGVGDGSLSLLPVLATVLTVVMLTRLAQQQFGTLAGILTGCLYASFPPTVGLGWAYLPEPIANAEIVLATVLFLQALAAQEGSAWRLYAAGLLIGLAYLTTEVCALMVGVFGSYLVLSQRLRVRHVLILAGFATVFAAEVAGNVLFHGNPLYRFSLSGAYVQDPMLVSQNADLSYRLLKAYPSLFVHANAHFGWFGPLLVGGAMYGAIQFRRCSLFLLWAAIIFLFYNFMTASFTHYVALPADARLINPACVPLVVLCGAGLADLLRRIGGASSNRLRYAGFAAVAALLGGLLVTSLALLDWGIRFPGKTELIARNAKALAGEIAEVDSIEMVSDDRSNGLLSFYRGFRPGDSYTEFSALSQALDQPDRLRSGSQLMVTLNMPALYAAEITGSKYGAAWDRPVDREAIRSAMSGRCEASFSTNADTGRPLLDPFLGDGWTSRVLQVRDTLKARPIYATATLYRCRRGAPGG